MKNVPGQMFTPGDQPVVLGGCSAGHRWIGASVKTNLTDFKQRRVRRKKMMRSKVRWCGQFLPTV